MFVKWSVIPFDGRWSRLDGQVGLLHNRLGRLDVVLGPLHGRLDWWHDRIFLFSGCFVG